MKQKMSIHKRIFQSLTLSQRLTLWIAGLLILLGFGEALLITGFTNISVPRTIATVMLMPTPESDFEPSPESIPSVSEMQNPTYEETLQEAVISDVRSISLIMAGVFTLIGIIGAYWISQSALRPVKNLSQMVKDIQADSLDKRLALQGAPDEVKELADSFDRMLSRLERAFEQQGRFMSDAAHELRTPLTTLQTHLEIIHQDSKATLSDYQEMSTTLKQALGRLIHLTEDFLLLGSGEKELVKEPVNLEVLLTEVLHELTSLAKANQVRLTIKMAEEMIIPADTRLLGRAISNLIENGIRYNHPGGFVTIRVDRQQKGVAIHIEDTGIGIEEGECPHIFERFYRVDRSRARNKGGAGLGLAITAHIVQLHSGHLQVTSTPGKGSIFTIWLPANANNLLKPSDLMLT